MNHTKQSDCVAAFVATHRDFFLLKRTLLPTHCQKMKKIIFHYSHFHFIALCVNNRKEENAEDEIYFFLYSVLFEKFQQPQQTILHSSNVCEDVKHEKGIEFLLCVFIPSLFQFAPVHKNHLLPIFMLAEFFATVKIM